MVNRTAPGVIGAAIETAADRDRLMGCIVDRVAAIPAERRGTARATVIITYDDGEPAGPIGCEPVGIADLPDPD